MAYVSDLVDGVPVKMTILDGGPLESLVRAPIGRDDATGTQYSVVVSLIRLDPFFGEEVNMELTFDVVAHDGLGPTYIGDGSATTFIVGNERFKVLCLVCEAAMLLLQRRNPISVTYSTLQPNLPTKALHKYRVLGKAVRDCGYVGGDADEFDGHRIWMFTKPSNVT